MESVELQQVETGPLEPGVAMGSSIQWVAVEVHGEWVAGRGSIGGVFSARVVRSAEGWQAVLRDMQVSRTSKIAKQLLRRAPVLGDLSGRVMELNHYEDFGLTLHDCKIDNAVAIVENNTLQWEVSVGWQHPAIEHVQGCTRLRVAKARGLPDASAWRVSVAAQDPPSCDALAEKVRADIGFLASAGNRVNEANGLGVISLVFESLLSVTNLKVYMGAELAAPLPHDFAWLEFEARVSIAAHETASGNLLASNFAAMDLKVRKAGNGWLSEGGLLEPSGVNLDSCKDMLLNDATALQAATGGLENSNHTGVLAVVTVAFSKVEIRAGGDRMIWYGECEWGNPANAVAKVTATAGLHLWQVKGQWQVKVEWQSVATKHPAGKVKQLLVAKPNATVATKDALQEYNKLGALQIQVCRLVDSWLAIDTDGITLVWEASVEWQSPIFSQEYCNAQVKIAYPDPTSAWWTCEIYSQAEPRKLSAGDVEVWGSSKYAKAREGGAAPP